MKREHVLAALVAVLGVAVAVLLGVVVFRAPARPHARVVASRTSADALPSRAANPAASRGGTLKVGYDVRNRWPGGFTVELVVTNLGGSPVEGWTVRLRLPPDVTVARAWSADVSQVNGVVNLRSQPWNAYLAPGGVVRLGFEATGNPTVPTSCTVNDSPC